MAEHSEHRKTAEPDRGRAMVSISPCGIRISPPPITRLCYFTERPFPHQPGEIPEPVKEVMEIQKARSASRACRYGYTRPDSAQSRCARFCSARSVGFCSRTLCAGCKLFPSATGRGAEPTAVRSPGPYDAPHVPHGHGCWRICTPAGADRFPAWMDEKVVGTPRPIGYISATPLAGRCADQTCGRRPGLSSLPSSSWVWC